MGREQKKSSLFPAVHPALPPSPPLGAATNQLLLLFLWQFILITLHHYRKRRMNGFSIGLSVREDIKREERSSVCCLLS